MNPRRRQEANISQIINFLAPQIGLGTTVRHLLGSASKNIEKDSQNWAKIDPKSTPNGPKKSSEKHSKNNVERSMKKLPKMALKWSQNRSQSRPDPRSELLRAARTSPLWEKDARGSHRTPKLTKKMPKMDQQSNQNHPKIIKKMKWFVCLVFSLSWFLSFLVYLSFLVS